jgi:hypothetical protein
MGRISPSFRQLYEETISELKMELQAALVDLGHKSAFDLLLKEAWNPEQAAMGNSTLPTVCDKLNVMASIHNRKLIAALARELNQRDLIINKLEERIDYQLSSSLSEKGPCITKFPIQNLPFMFVRTMDLSFTSALESLPSCNSFLFKEVFKIGTLPFNQGKEMSKEKARMD